MKTNILASIYEMQGLKKEALDIYKNIHEQDSTNTQAKLAIRRLSQDEKQYKSKNQKMLKFFHSMKHDNEIKEFERWLLNI